jgi:glucokinase
MSKKALAIGIDVGGTKIAMVVGNAQGKILASRVIPTDSLTRNAIPEMVKNLKALAAMPRFKKKLLGIGIGVPGPINNKTGIVPFSPNLKGWTSVNLKKILQKELRLPVYMANDANAAALGEKRFGEGRGKSDFIYITVSTGIGGGIIVDGKLLVGTSCVGGEVGHMCIVAEGEPCGCGRKGCLEAYASGTAMARTARKYASKAEMSGMMRFNEKGEPFSAKTIGIAASHGNKAAIRIYEAAGFYLGIGIANLLNILNPQRVILGGGVFKSAPKQFRKAMLASCERYAWPEAYKAVQIVNSKLEGHSGDLGALALAFENLQ